MKVLNIAACVIIAILSGRRVNAQEMPQAYFDHIKKADSLYAIKNCQGATTEFSAAFRTNGWKGLANDRYNAACSWALAGNADSAFFQLEQLPAIEILHEQQGN